MLRLLTLSALAAMLASCTTPPLQMDASHPASCRAPEASTPAARASLRPDANTLRTRELLAQREQQARAAASETPIDELPPGPAAARPSPGPAGEPGGMKGMNP